MRIRSGRNRPVAAAEPGMMVAGITRSCRRGKARFGDHAWKICGARETEVCEVERESGSDAIQSVLAPRMQCRSLSALNGKWSMVLMLMVMLMMMTRLLLVRINACARVDPALLFCPFSVTLLPPFPHPPLPLPLHPFILPSLPLIYPSIDRSIYVSVCLSVCKPVHASLSFYLSFSVFFVYPHH